MVIAAPTRPTKGTLQPTIRGEVKPVAHPGLHGVVVELGPGVCTCWLCWLPDKPAGQCVGCGRAAAGRLLVLLATRCGRIGYPVPDSDRYGRRSSRCGNAVATDSRGRPTTGPATAVSGSREPGLKPNWHGCGRGGPRLPVFEPCVHKPRIVEVCHRAAYFQRASNAQTPTASRSDKSSNRCSTTTTATIIAHAAPTHIVNKSANISSKQVEALPVQHTINRIRGHPPSRNSRRLQIRLNRRPSQPPPLIQLQATPISAGPPREKHHPPQAGFA